jgi:hypothetical protein
LYAVLHTRLDNKGGIVQQAAEDVTPAAATSFGNSGQLTVGSSGISCYTRRSFLIFKLRAELDGHDHNLKNHDALQ